MVVNIMRRYRTIELINGQWERNWEYGSLGDSLGTGLTSFCPPALICHDKGGTMCWT